MNLPTSLQNAILEFSKLPGIGTKSAQRLGLFLLKRDAVDIELLASAIKNIQATVQFCSICHTMADTDPCYICSDLSRSQDLLCVVEEALDAIVINKSGAHKGLFHVLGGVLNPLDGIGPKQLQIESLLSRISEPNSAVLEIILATNPTMEGEATARYIAKLVQEIRPEIKITRIARGIPTGGDLEYADDLTLSRALEGRREY